MKHKMNENECVNYKNQEKMVLFLTGLLVIYLFFISRRGGSTRYLFSIVLIGTIIMQIVITKKNKFKEYKYLYLTGIGYIFFICLSYLKVPNKITELPIFLNVVLYSIGFLLVGLNGKFEKKLYNNFIPLITIFSYDAIYRGIKELPLYFGSAYRLTGGTGSPTVYATEIGLYIIIGVCGLFYCEKKIAKACYLTYLLINILLMFGTQSRALLLFLPLTFIILIFIKKRREGIVLLCGMMVIGMVVLKNADKIPFMGRLNTLNGVEQIENDARMVILKKGVEIEKEIFPESLGFYAYRNGKLVQTSTKKYSDKVLEIDSGKGYIHFHNNILEILVTQGIFSLIFYVIFNLLIFKELLKKYLNSNENNQTNILASVALGTYIYFTLLGLVEVTFYFEKSSLLVYTILMITFSEKTNNKYMEGVSPVRNEIKENSFDY